MHRPKTRLPGAIPIGDSPAWRTAGGAAPADSAGYLGIHTSPASGGSSRSPSGAVNGGALLFPDRAPKFLTGH